MKLMGAPAPSIGDSTGLLPGITAPANFAPTNPDNGTWKITKADGKTLTAKGLLRIEIEGEQEYYLLRLSDKSDLRIQVPFMNNHRLRFDRNVGKVVTVTGQFKEAGGKKVVVSLKSAKAEEPAMTLRRPFLWLALIFTGLPPAKAADFAAAIEVIEDRCLACHDADTKKGGINLTPMLDPANASYGKHTKLWIRLEKMVGHGELPPENKRPLAAAETQAITGWFHQSFVLREGKEHIGPTPLRRLTRYEFENTLEDVLAIRLKAPYRDTITGRIEVSKIASLVPSDIPGVSGCNNDAHRLGKLRPPLKELANAANHALAKFSKDPKAMQTVLGRATIPKDLGEAECKQHITKFILRAHRGNADQLDDYASGYLRQFQRHRRTSKDSHASLMHVFEMILVAPEFLFRFERSKAQDTPYPITGWEIATGVDCVRRGREI